MKLLPGVLAALDLPTPEPLGAPAARDGRSNGPAFPSPRLTGGPVFASPLAVGDCAVASVAACLVAAAELAHARTGRRPDISLDTAHVAAAMRSEIHLRDPAGNGIDGFAPLSRLWPAADGWVRTHANYPWHRAALLTALGVTDDPGPAIAALPAAEVERRVYAAGGLAVAARTPRQWRAACPPDSPLISFTPTAHAPALPAPTGPLPASGLRILDLTRVIAGPAGTRMLAALGADVLRVDDPNRPELPLHALDGVIGKASTEIDAATAEGLRTLHRLIGEADVVVTGYRPGALRRFGLAPDQIAERRPGTVVATLSAWGTTGPWADRRGFDSLVQIATGIGWAVSPDGVRPGALPCQLLDHATGYLLAAGILTALARRARGGSAGHVVVSLTRTATWLLDQPRTTPFPGTGDAHPIIDGYRVPLGDGWSGISPPGLLDGHRLSWPHLPPRYGHSPAAFPS
ncbi:putative L-carnitine dehydratase [Actinoplanes lobatus]|uniref:Crotonobetainyl-CoA:carnitine CoA-transferase CaiB-like acyl-CoA transferase n=1 Tax=Actinoplanes lobatus TaxID=113568 RepID=A0A7W7HPD2_9ACTN|nr:CoA transferase [Actinoplanes lobatus]MBB4754236.1 crotonobetainyl-CoA:carnitine CoA-transferase CaiB-like acyl-CoA transferase [Actinoplanes lobatus]GGN62038.1 putative L-carnitine dehydratase [Actinoplanes lobatus]GIE44887.1 putative L-carnitine dehydratase [Actinoplanes lobatus]